jgi:hypothetical protein
MVMFVMYVTGCLVLWDRDFAMAAATMCNQHTSIRRRFLDDEVADVSKSKPKN